MKDEDIKLQCPISDPFAILKPQISVKAFLEVIYAANVCKENTIITRTSMLFYMSFPSYIPPVLTPKQCSDYKSSIARYVQALRDDLANIGLYIAKKKNTYYILYYSQNEIPVKQRLFKASRASDRNEILLQNTPPSNLPKRTLLLKQNKDLRDLLKIII